MKTNVLRTSILALMVAAAGYAQSSLSVHADIPFNFFVGSTSLAAGSYTVDQGRPGVIVIKSADGKENAVVLSRAVERPVLQSASTLVFHRYGDTYLLSQVWTEGSNRGTETPVTSRERELSAKQTAPDETIILAKR